MRFLPFALALLAWSPSVVAQPQTLFSPGQAPTYKEEEFDRRFERSQFQKALSLGTQDPHCARVLGGLLTLLAEAAPSLHKYDENFSLDPTLVDAMSKQLTTPRFPANLYLALMVRRVFLDKKLPAPWFETASRLRSHVNTLDVGKLRYLAEGLRPIENANFTLAMLRERYAIEVKKATSISASNADAVFRDNYLDREVTFTGLELIDLTAHTPPPAPPSKKSKEEAEVSPPPGSGIVAQLMWLASKPKSQNLNEVIDLIIPQEKDPTVKLTVRLRREQYLDLSRLPKGTRVLVRGRLWDYKNELNEIELRDAVLFQDRDWSKGVNLVDRRSLALCPLAVNEVSGLAPNQPGGFGQR